MGSYWSYEVLPSIEITEPEPKFDPQLDNKIIESIKEAEIIRTDIMDELKHNSNFRDRRAKSIAKE